MSYNILSNIMCITVLLVFIPNTVQRPILRIIGATKTVSVCLVPMRIEIGSSTDLDMWFKSRQDPAHEPNSSNLVIVELKLVIIWSL